MLRGLCFILKFQVIIPASWVFAVILIVPMFIVKDVVKSETGNLCMYVFAEEWMGRAYTTTWNIVFFLPLALMIGLYSKVVHTLWLKGRNDNQLTYQQQASFMCRIQKNVVFPCLFPSCSSAWEEQLWVVLRTIFFSIHFSENFKESFFFYILLNTE